jgi:hypothetical protein
VNLKHSNKYQMKHQNHWRHQILQTYSPVMQLPIL